MSRTLTLLGFAASLLIGSAAAAQGRPARPVPELTHATLSRLLLAERGSVGQCARRHDTSAYVASLRVRVAPGPPPATLHRARISVQVRSRPRDPGFEGCVRRAVGDSLRQRPYAVGRRAVTARRTFQIDERTPAPLPQPAPRFSEGDVRRVLRAMTAQLRRCVGVQGVPEQVTLRVAVEADGRLVLTSADVPVGASRQALSCLARRVSSVRVRARPARRVALVHRFALRR